MGFHQSQMSRQVIFLQTELNPTQKMLKPSFQLSQLQDSDDDIYLRTKFQTYLNRPVVLHSLTYPEFYQWWRSATAAEQRKANRKGEATDLCPKGGDDFNDFICIQQIKDHASSKLSDLLEESEVTITNGYDLLALCRTLHRLKIPPAVVDAIQKYYNQQGIESIPPSMHWCPTEASQVVADVIDDSALLNGLSAHHWLMDNKLRDNLITVLTGYKPGTVLQDVDGHNWYRRAKMLCTRHRFISSVGDDQEKFYEQKYLLTVPITPQSEVVLNPPASWVEFCVSQGMCDEHFDAMSCMQSAVSRGFHTDSLRKLAQVYVEHGFLTDDEADIFLNDIPVLGEKDESEATVHDHMLHDESRLGTPRLSDTPRYLSANIY